MTATTRALVHSRAAATLVAVATPCVLVFLTVQNLLQEILKLPLGPLGRAWLLLPLALWMASPAFRCDLRQPHHQWFIAWIALLALHGIWLIARGYPTAAVIGISGWAMWGGLFLWLSISRHGLMFNTLAVAVLVAGLIHVPALLTEHITGVPIQSVDRYGGFGHIPRYDGIAVNNGLMGIQVTFAGLVCTHFLCLPGPRGWHRFSLYVLLAIVASAVMLTTIRGAVLLFWIGIVLMLFLQPIPAKRRALVLGVVIVATAGTLMMFLTAQSAKEYIIYLINSFSLADPGNKARIATWKGAVSGAPDGTDYWRYIKAVVGEGAGLLSFAARFAPGPMMGLESSVLRMILELGLAGFALFGGFILSVVWYGWRQGAYRTPDGILAFVLLAVSLLRAAHNDMLQTWPGSFYLWAALGMIVMASRAADVQAS